MLDMEDQPLYIITVLIGVDRSGRSILCNPIIRSSIYRIYRLEEGQRKHDEEEDKNRNAPD
ncbi:hypothetical protein D3C84_1274390 [compost metagenome]